MIRADKRPTLLDCIVEFNLANKENKIPAREFILDIIYEVLPFVDYTAVPIPALWQIALNVYKTHQYNDAFYEFCGTTYIEYARDEITLCADGSVK